MVQTQMPAFVVNLHRSKERREWVRNHFREVGVTFEFFEGIDGTTLDTKEIEDAQNAATTIIGRKFTSGEIGCATSHIKVYEHIVSERIPIASIFEDDVEVTDYQSLRRFLELKKEDVAPYELILLGYKKPMIKSADNPAILKYRKRKVLFKWKGDFFIGQPALIHWLAVGYVVTLSAAEKLLQHAYPIRMPADCLTANSEVYNVMLGAVNRPLLRPKPNLFDSEIGQRVFEINSEFSHPNHVLEAIGKFLHKSAYGRFVFSSYKLFVQKMVQLGLIDYKHPFT